MEVSRPLVAQETNNSLCPNDLYSTRPSPSNQRRSSQTSSNHELDYDSVSVTTAIDVFYAGWGASSISQSLTSPVRNLRSYQKNTCPLASAESVHLLGDTATDLSRGTAASDLSPVANSWEKKHDCTMKDGERDDDSRRRNGAIKDNGTLPTRAAASSSNHAKGHVEAEEAQNVNETIRDDDSMGDKTPKRDVPASQPNGDSKTLSTFSHAKSALNHPPFHALSSYASASSTRKLSDSEFLDDDYDGASGRSEGGNTGAHDESGEFKGRYTRQFLAAFAANFGAMALGTVQSWTSPALPDLRQRKTIGEISVEEETWISAIALLGAASACPIIGYGIERFGRKRCLLLLTLPYLVGWLLITLAQNIWMIYAGRFLSGFCGGGGSIAIPVYITEAASTKIRGMLASGFDMMITVGILYIFVVGTFVSWEWQAVACGALPLVFHLLMLLVPESPTYLIEQGRNPDASNALQWLRGASSSQQVESELQELISSVNESKNKSATWKDLLELPALKPTLLAVFLMVFQQLAAIDAVMFYTVDIFEESGVDINENLSANIVGAIQVMATITAAIVVDHGGRRLLLLISELFMVISLGTLGLFFYLKHHNNDVAPEGLGWLPLASLMVYVVAFSVGMGPLPWLLMGELLPLHIKGKASGLVTITRWLLGFGVTFLFQFLKAVVGAHGCYWVFCGCCLVGGIFVLIFVPETKGKSLDEIQVYFAKTRAASPSEDNLRRRSSGKTPV